MKKSKLNYLIILSFAAALLGCPPNGLQETQTAPSRAATKAKIEKNRSESKEVTLGDGSLLRPSEELFTAKDGFLFMLKSIVFAAQPGRSLGDLINLLAKSDQNPRVYTDPSQRFFENQVVVRTDQPMVGTRYFHGIYFSLGDQLIPSHLSFETNLGFDEAIEIVKSLSVTGKKITDEEDFSNGHIGWNFESDYEIRIKKLVSDDLIGHPNNAYTIDDIGIVVLTIERKHDLLVN